jgi:hypothetical protein
MSKQKISQKTANTRIRHDNIRKEFYKMYNEDLIRFDVCMTRMAKKWGLSEITVRRIIAASGKD